MKGKRRRHSAEFKAKVAIEALKSQKTVSQIASDHGVHPVQVSEWKKQLLEGSTEIFTRGRRRGEAEELLLKSSLYEQIGRLKMELEWLKKKVGPLS